MANGSNHDRLGAHIAALEKRFEDRSTRRDDESAETKALIADLAARLGNLESSVGATQAIVEGIRNIKPPGVLALWGPTLGTAVALASLFVFVLNQAIGPHEGDIVELKADVRVIQDRQYSALPRLAKVEGRLEYVERHIEDVDKIGPRKFNSRTTPAQGD